MIVDRNYCLNMFLIYLIGLSYLEAMNKKKRDKTMKKNRINSPEFCKLRILG